MRRLKIGIVIKDIDVNGTNKLKEILKDMGIKVVTIFLRVPKDELQRRLENRIDKLSHEEIMLRLNRFDYEESKMNIYDYVMKNDNLEKAISIIETIINQEYREEQEAKENYF
jgi:guanylate kinase